jgi:GWxTD domain-containing protein
MINSHRFLHFLILILILSCSRATNPDIDRGASYLFEEGFPEVRVSAIGYLTPADQAYINVTSDIVYSSLVYRYTDDENLARITIETMITGKDDGSTFSETERQSLEIERTDDSYVQSLEVYTYETDIYVNPGRYNIAVTVVDEATGKQTVRETDTYIPDPGFEGVNLTSVRLLGKDLNDETPQYTPVTTYSIPSRVDSLFFSYQVMNNREDEPLDLISRLIKFESDSQPAIPMNFNNPSASSLIYKGIDYTEYDVLEQVSRVIDQSGSVNIEFQTPILEEGNYRFEVQSENLDKKQFYKARDFSIKPDNYPTLRTPRELAEPLIYLMDRRDHERLMSISNPDSLKAAMDRFWITNINNSARARSVIQKYYERVEEANKQFSNYKEGWKTDLGMIYILFGQPWYVESRLRRMYWSYSYDRTDPRLNFYFEAPKVRNEFFPFDHYLLIRHRDYHNVQYQQVQLWLSGQILTTNI